MLILTRTSLFLTLCVPAVSAQERSLPPVADSSVARIMKSAGSKAEAPWLRDMLRQTVRKHPKAKLDEIGDSLMARATNPAGRNQGSEDYSRGVNAINALMLAGSGAPMDGVPYDGAFDRMVKVHRSAASFLIRARALGGMLGTPSHARAVSYLRETAESTDSTAIVAIQFLIADANGGGWTRSPTATEQQESVAALKALAARKRVTDGGAAKLLGLWIARNGS